MMRRWLPPLLILAAAAASLLLWPRLPDQLPVHWNVQGEVDRYGGKAEGAFLAPGVMLALYLMLRFLPRIDPRRANYARMTDTYEFVIALLMVFLFAVHLAVLAAGLGYDVPMQRVAPVGVGLLLLALGNVLPRAKPNWWFGIRTPWTLSSDRVWMRTHRAGGYAMMAAGGAILASAFANPPVSTILFVAGIAVGAGFPFVYSYLAWRQENASR